MWFLQQLPEFKDYYKMMTSIQNIWGSFSIYAILNFQLHPFSIPYFTGSSVWHPWTRCMSRGKHTSALRTNEEWKRMGERVRELEEEFRLKRIKNEDIFKGKSFCMNFKERHETRKKIHFNLSQRKPQRGIPCPVYMSHHFPRTLLLRFLVKVKIIWCNFYLKRNMKKQKKK